MELAILDPDGHVITFFKYFEDDAEWEAAEKEIPRGTRTLAMVIRYKRCNRSTPNRHPDPWLA